VIVDDTLAGSEIGRTSVRPQGARISVTTM
jgi:hypothetical protein